MQLRTRTTPWAAALWLCLAAVSAPPIFAQAFPPPPTEQQATEARALIEAMKVNERGPYERLRWFCADGSVQPPQGTPCRERGGGVQHAELSSAGGRLADLGYSVGTILQATPYEAFADEARAGYRLREMVLERYLFGIDDGWVLRRARYYRGALQIEDEERAGRALLERRLADGAWLRSNYLLASRLAAALPHTSLGDERLMDRIRATALEISNADAGFMSLRVKIHSVPSREDGAAVERYLARGSHEPRVRDWLVQLRDDLAQQYDAARALSSLAAYRGRVGGDVEQGLARLGTALESGDPERALAAVVDLAPRVRVAAEGAANGRQALDLIDLGLALQERAFVLASSLEAPAPAPTRAQVLARTDQYVALAYAAGYLSAREREALHDQVGDLIRRGSTTALAYKTDLGYVSRSLDWARGTVRGTFLPVLDRYLPVEPAAAGLPDDLLRGSVILPLSRTLDLLHTDADQSLGAAHSVFGRDEPTGLRGLNPGVAVRRLEVLRPGAHEEVDAQTIYALPETPPELKPVAGVLTLAEGNLLSHVQLLARNLGIPNATMTPDLMPRLREAEGREIFYAVSPMGRVVLAWPDRLGPAEQALTETGGSSRTERHRLDVSRVRLDVRRPIPLAELRSTDSGVLVGPKAANLGQLAADFPGRVSAALALPFGIFHAHADRPWVGSAGTVLEELRAAYTRAAAMEAEGRTDSEVDAYMFERLAWVRDAIAGLEWLPDARAEIARAVTEMLDGDLSRGVFVRSDTNVEDLPEFSGAGLNLTVANQTSIDQVLAAVKRVWTSPFAERAYLWRRQILEEQGGVYPSVLIQETVRSDKSGVLITSGLQEGGPDDLTVVAAEGVGGAVDGEDAETLLIAPNGDVRLLSQAKAPSRRDVIPGGTRWVAAERPERLLQPDELAQLQDVVATWQSLKAGTPEADTTWDIEYGFLNGRLWLFQIRPFIRYRNSDLYERLSALDAGARANAGRIVRLEDTLELS
ncbi:MAG TPA: PEP/pyruvate-binding domain-containing protein [Longimicrobiales bacterium]|nr:PEP/pyruvate-binding domain-containing protein [Longimicrobiales bacterium]